MRLSELVATSRAVAATSGRLQKIALLSAHLRRAADSGTASSADVASDLAISIAFLSGSLRQGRIGVGAAAILEARQASSSASASLELGEVDAVFGRVHELSGPGSMTARTTLLRELFARATPDEQDFLAALLFGEIRQGALEGVLLDAIAMAANLPAPAVRRAAMVSGDLAATAQAALTRGESGLTELAIQLFRPVAPMLADSAPDVAEALGALGEASLEHKLDGARIQVHKDQDRVQVFSRNLRDVTHALPEVVELVRTLPMRRAILDGEAIALRPEGAPHPFQITMKRFGRKLDVGALRATLPIAPFFFDTLYVDDGPLIDEPLHRRQALVDAVVPAEARLPRLVTADAEAAQRFGEEAIARGHEGVMAKAPESVYSAGRRGSAWLKVKRARTLDLVVLAVEWGNGRRTGLLSNLHLGARDPERGGFVMLGKTFKGLTDEMLAWQTRELLARELAREGHIVHVRPELVVEVAFNEIQESSQYPGRLALRFARVKRYRTDKRGDEADTFASVQRIYRDITGLEPPVR